MTGASRGCSVHINLKVRVNAAVFRVRHNKVNIVIESYSKVVNVTQASQYSVNPSLALALKKDERNFFLEASGKTVNSYVIAALVYSMTAS